MNGSRLAPIAANQKGGSAARARLIDGINRHTGTFFDGSLQQGSIRALFRFRTKEASIMLAGLQDEPAAKDVDEKKRNFRAVRRFDDAMSDWVETLDYPFQVFLTSLTCGRCKSKTADCLSLGVVDAENSQQSG